MEEAEAEDKPCMRLGLDAVREHSVVALHHRAEDISSEALRRLVRHLHAVLQEQRWELPCGHGGEPEAVIVVRRLRVHLLADALELGKPRDGQVAIAKEDPTTCLRRTLDHPLSLWTLSLAEGDTLELRGHASGLREGDHVGHRVAAGGEHEDERGHLRGVLIGDGDVEGRWLHKLLPHLLSHELDDGGGQAVGAECTQVAHPLKGAQLRLPRGRQGLLVRLRGIVDSLERLHVLGEERIEALERRQQ
mmetsp:Transcript_4434/g.9109  ORF Transcript_4434/g.9109 Transcript_4434/m.9109 type:complete len:248 (+) Transcript_4434:1450-2193(+)